MCVCFLSAQYLVRCWTFYKLTWYGSALSWAGVSGAVLQCEDCVVCIECVCVWTGAGIMDVSVWWLCGVYWMCVCGQEQASWVCQCEDCVVCIECVCVDRSRHHGCVSVRTVWFVCWALSVCVCMLTGAGIVGVSVWWLWSVEYWMHVCMLTGARIVGVSVWGLWCVEYWMHVCVCMLTGVGTVGVSMWGLWSVEYWMHVCVDRSRHRGCASVRTVVWWVLNACVCGQEQALWVCQCDDCGVCIECVCVWTGAGIVGVPVWGLCSTAAGAGLQEDAETRQLPGAVGSVVGNRGEPGVETPRRVPQLPQGCPPVPSQVVLLQVGQELLTFCPGILLNWLIPCPLPSAFCPILLCACCPITIALCLLPHARKCTYTHNLNACSSSDGCRVT